MESEAEFDKPFCFYSWLNALETRLREAPRHMYKFTYKISWRLDLSEVYVVFHRFSACSDTLEFQGRSNEEGPVSTRETLSQKSEQESDLHEIYEFNSWRIVLCMCLMGRSSSFPLFIVTEYLSP